MKKPKKKHNPDLTGISALIPTELHKKFHAAAAKDRRSASSMLRIIMEEYLAKTKQS
jgi:hypothetical protein